MADRFTTTYVEVLNSGDTPVARFSTVFVEILHSIETAVVPVGGGVFCILGGDDDD